MITQKQLFFKQSFLAMDVIDVLQTFEQKSFSECGFLCKGELINVLMKLDEKFYLYIESSIEKVLRNGCRLFNITSMVPALFPSTFKTITGS